MDAREFLGNFECQIVNSLSTRVGALMSKRQLPLGRGWLRQYLRDHLEVTVASNVGDDELQRICDEIPARDWARLSNAWRQHRRNGGPRYISHVHTADEQCKRLGIFWKRLISQGFITEEDALLLAENYFQGCGGYSDEMAKDMVRKILSGVCGTSAMLGSRSRKRSAKIRAHRSVPAPPWTSAHPLRVGGGRLPGAWPASWPSWQPSWPASPSGA